MGKPKQPQNSPRRARGLQLPTDALLEASPRPRGTYKLEPQTEKQRRLISTIGANQLTFVEGPAGTGKTFVASALAALELHHKTVDRVIVTRPNVEAGTPMGFLPGDEGEKFAPYFAPVRRVFEIVLGKAFVEYALDAGKIEIAPIPFLRGATFENAFVLCDEAQNMTPKEMELFLTRIGERSRIVVDGDPVQKDIAGPEGFTDAIQRLRGVKSVAHFTFDIDDIVRSGLCREVILAYRKKAVPANDDRGFVPPAFLLPAA